MSAQLRERADFHEINKMFIHKICMVGVCVHTVVCVGEQNCNFRQFNWYDCDSKQLRPHACNKKPS